MDDLKPTGRNPAPQQILRVTGAIQQCNIRLGNPLGISSSRVAYLENQSTMKYWFGLATRRSPKRGDHDKETNRRAADWWPAAAAAAVGTAAAVEAAWRIKVAGGVRRPTFRDTHATYVPFILDGMPHRPLYTWNWMNCFASCFASLANEHSCFVTHSTSLISPHCFNLAFRSISHLIYFHSSKAGISSNILT